MEKILIIDDSVVQSRRLKDILSDKYEVTLAHTASDGLALAKTGDYALFLLDVIMPDMDGFTLLKKLQEELATEHIPVIMITSLSDIHSEEHGLLLGAVDYIVKPFNAVIVKARVNTHVKQHQYRMQIERQVLKDELTQVANRRHYNQCSITRWQEAIRLKTSFSVCMFDIDKFKVYNDTYGHLAGDQVLTMVAQTVNSHLQRSTDFFARYGGEEFVAVVLGGESQKVFKHFKMIRQAVEDQHMEHSGSVSPWVTVSMGGITVYPKMGDRYEDYLKMADSMLYDAKSYGRNQVVWANEKGIQWKERG